MFSAHMILQVLELKRSVTLAICEEILIGEHSRLQFVMRFLLRRERLVKERLVRFLLSHGRLVEQLRIRLWTLDSFGAEMCVSCLTVGGCQSWLHKMHFARHIIRHN